MSPVQRGNKLFIPNLTEEEKKNVRVTVKWQQTLIQRQADYYVLTAKNSNQSDADVALFIEATRYDEQHLGPKNSAGFYELTMDDRSQYGQRNAAGEGRWVVFHNKDYKPFQHRFIESSFLSKNASMIVKVCGIITNQEAGVNSVADVLKSLFGDYLHTF